MSTPADSMKLVPSKFDVRIKIFEADGFVLKRISGSHHILAKEGNDRPVVIPRHGKDVPVPIIRSNMRAARMSRERYFELLEEVTATRRG